MFLFTTFNFLLLQILVDAQSPTVTISAGVIEGTATLHPTATVGVNKYLGIPFAAPPKRFSPPVDPQPWDGLLNATAWKPSCIQEWPYPKLAHDRSVDVYSLYGILGPVRPESEDCLYLNVYTPSTPAPPGGRAVIFWIYGGDFQFGHAGQPIYDGTSFAANQDIILVAFNHRANAFGNVATPVVPITERNLAFLDQRKALEWVQVNIHAFGGDPQKVTIAGLSSGGNSVKQLVAAPPQPVPFRAAIISSQTNSGTPEHGPIAFQYLANATGCADAADTLECLRGVDPLQIRDIATEASLYYPPTRDNVTAVANILDQFYSGKAARVPLMMGTTLDDGRGQAYVVGANATNSDNSLTAPEIFGVFLDQLYPGNDELVKPILDAYPENVKNNTFEFFGQMLTDLLFVCSTSKITSTAAELGYDVWRYYYTPGFPNQVNIFPDAGVYHASDASCYFGNYVIEGQPPTPYQVETCAYVQKVWADFAKDPMKGPGWPQIGKNQGNETFAFGKDGSTTGSLIQQAVLDQVCPVYQKILIATGL